MRWLFLCGVAFLWVALAPVISPNQNCATTARVQLPVKR